jgi:hypothetical protein
MTISLAATVSGISVFGGDLTIIAREAAAGHNLTAFYIGHASAQLYRMVLMALHFTFCYHVLFTPDFPFGDMFAIVLLLFCVFYSIAQIFSLLFAADAQLTATLVCMMFALITCMFNGFVTQFAVGFKQIFAPWWASEAYFTRQSDDLLAIFKVEQNSVAKFGFTRGQFGTDMGALVAIALGCQMIGALMISIVFKLHAIDRLAARLQRAASRGFSRLISGKSQTMRTPPS